MKTFLLSSIIILVTFCQLSAIVLVQENFNSGPFPPTGWSMERQGSASWDWYPYGPTFAFGQYLHGPTDPQLSGQACLFSNPFVLTANHAITIDFNRICFIYDCSGAWFKVSLQRDTTTVWELSLPVTPGMGWEFTEVETPIQTVSSSNYKVVWSFYGYAYSLDSENAVEFSLDDVLVFYDDTSVIPQSLGLIKAAFK